MALCVVLLVRGHTCFRLHVGNCHTPSSCTTRKRRSIRRRLSDVFSDVSSTSISVVRCAICGRGGVVRSPCMLTGGRRGEGTHLMTPQRGELLLHILRLLPVRRLLRADCLVRIGHGLLHCLAQVASVIRAWVCFVHIVYAALKVAQHRVYLEEGVCVWGGPGGKGYLWCYDRLALQDVRDVVLFVACVEHLGLRCGGEVRHLALLVALHVWVRNGACLPARCS